MTIINLLYLCRIFTSVVRRQTFFSLTLKLFWMNEVRCEMSSSCWITTSLVPMNLAYFVFSGLGSELGYLNPGGFGTSWKGLHFSTLDIRGESILIRTIDGILLPGQRPVLTFPSLFFFYRILFIMFFIFLIIIIHALKSSRKWTDS